MLVGGVAILCGLVVVLRPDPEPGWPALLTFGKLGLATVVLVMFGYALRPFGFLIPTALAYCRRRGARHDVEPTFRLAPLSGPSLAFPP